MKKSIVWLLIGFSVLLAGCSAQAPAEEGIYLRQGTAFAALLPQEASMERPLISDLRAALVMRLPAAQLGALRLRGEGGLGRVYQFTAESQPDGTFIVRPNELQEPGMYCFVQGDVESPLATWCYETQVYIPPYTTPYKVLGFAVFAGVMGLYLLSLYLRRRALQRDLNLLQ